ncbi:SPW repeat domain-containing protein [Roseovarius aestuarii]|uniref:SPW repeat-containing integral membrane domain-containing protein n=1 Tax=Roseovarius aestuarii TaxID=475083 RepID=A0A1X7BVP5_9RHOB|nr:hypothetical protein [Roseovarius aestuarii]SMC13550.1 hypothetical protein ROA7745_03401 [Roseovarius aestuarii]
MNIRFLTPKMHGLVDYAAAAGLIIFPFVLGIGTSSPIAFWLSIVAGIVVISYSMLTGYAYSAVPMVPFKIHLAIDFVAAVGFALAPFVFGFAGLDAAYYWALSGAVFLVVAVSQPDQETSVRSASAA